MSTDRLSHHGVCLPGAGLAVSEHTSVVALERRLKHFGSHLLVHLSHNTHRQKHEKSDRLGKPKTSFGAHRIAKMYVSYAHFVGTGFKKK